MVENLEQVDDEGNITGVTSSEIQQFDTQPPEEEIVFQPVSDDARNTELPSNQQTTRSGRISKPPVNYTPSMGGESYVFATISRVLTLTTREPTKDFKIGKDYPYNKAKKLMGEDVVRNSAYKEFEQIHQRETFQPVDPAKMTREESEKIVRSIVLTKMKESGECKTRTVADGSQQRGTVADEDKTSPTVMLASIF